MEQFFLQISNHWAIWILLKENGQEGILHQYLVYQTDILCRRGWEKSRCEKEGEHKDMEESQWEIPTQYLLQWIIEVKLLTRILSHP